MQVSSPTHKKEILIMVSVLVLVALSSFALGLKLGKTINELKPVSQESLACAQNKEPALTAQQTNDLTPNATTQTPSVVSTAPTTVASITPTTTGQPTAPTEEQNTPPPTTNKDHYTLQVGAYPSLEDATQRVLDLKQKGFDAFSFEAKIEGRGTWYRVGIGVFSSKETAEQKGEEWKQSKNLPPYLARRIDE